MEGDLGPNLLLQTASPRATLVLGGLDNAITKAAMKAVVPFVANPWVGRGQSRDEGRGLERGSGLVREPRQRRDTPICVLRSRRDRCGRDMGEAGIPISGCYRSLQWLYGSVLQDNFVLRMLCRNRGPTYILSRFSGPKHFY